MNILDGFQTTENPLDLMETSPSFPDFPEVTSDSGLLPPLNFGSTPNPFLDPFQTTPEFILYDYDEILGVTDTPDFPLFGTTGLLINLYAFFITSMRVIRY